MRALRLAVAMPWFAAADVLVFVGRHLSGLTVGGEA